MYRLTGLGSVAVFPCTLVCLAAMWGWRISPWAKVILIIVNLLSCAVVGFSIWLLWFFTF
jgi:hypothetical protein